MEETRIENARRRRVAFLIDDLGYGGAQKQLALLADALQAHVGVEVHVLSTITEPYADVIRGSGPPVFAYRRRFRGDAAFFPGLVRALRRSGADVVHGFLDASNVYAYHAARAIGAAAVLSIQSDRLRLGGVRAAILGWDLRHAEAVTVNSAAGRDTLLREVGVRPERLHLVTNWIRIAAEAPGASAAPVVGFVGRLVDSKRVDLLIDAFAVVRRGRPDARLVVLGDGPRRGALEGHARRVLPESAFSFAGSVPDVEHRIPAFACVVIPSDFEGLPNVAVEALAAGVPIVARPAGDLPDLVREGRTGALAGTADAETLGEIIARVLDDDALRAAARREGPALAADRFSLSRAADTFAAIYRDAWARKQAGRR